MTIIRKGEDPATLAMIAISMVALATTLILLALSSTNKPDIRGMEQRNRNKEFNARLLNERARENLAQRRVTVVAQTWNMPEQQVGPTALANVTSLVRRSGLTLVSIRPQRRNEDGRFVQLPYLLTVDGSYPAVLSLCKSLEQPATKLAVSLVQISSADAASDRVTASIGLVAFMTPKEPTTSG